MFITTLNSQAVSIDRVRKVSCPTADGTLVLELDNGDTAAVEAELWAEELSRLSQQVVPAAPGTFLIYEAAAGEADGSLLEPCFARCTVVAWSIDDRGDAKPLTATVDSGSEGQWVVIHPDGSVDEPLETYDSYDQWLRDTREKRLARALVKS